jgi:hypothetical protein
LFGNLKRFCRLRKHPFSNISPQRSCNVQKEPLPGRSGVRGTLTKQSLNEREWRMEFCQEHFCREKCGELIIVGSAVNYLI